MDQWHHALTIVPEFIHSVVRAILEIRGPARAWARLGPGPEFQKMGNKEWICPLELPHKIPAVLGCVCLVERAS